MSIPSELQEMLQDFLTEAGELLAGVDVKLVELESRKDDLALLNEIFRGFHTIKGGAGFLGATALVEVCHRTESLFDQLRSGKRQVSPEMMDVILAATTAVQKMFDEMASSGSPEPADPRLIEALSAWVAGDVPVAGSAAAAQEPVVAVETPMVAASAPTPSDPNEPDWAAYYQAITGIVLPAAPATASASGSGAHPGGAEGTGPAVKVGTATATASAAASVSSAASGVASTPTRATSAAAPPAPSAPRSTAGSGKGGDGKESSLRIDITRFDQILNLSGEIGLVKNRLARLRQELLTGKSDASTLKSLDRVVGQLSALVGDLQNTVMKARMQPVGRVFQKYVRVARDLARQLGKDVELEITGEETEIDKTMLDLLNDPLIHLVRNAVDHGVDSPAERTAAGKPAHAIVRLSAQQVGDRVMIEIADDGRGMRPDVLREKVVEKGLMGADEAASLDDAAALNLIFLPGFSTKTEISGVSGRGVGMDVVRNNITRLNGRIQVFSVPNRGTRVVFSLPLTLAILPVLLFRQGPQTYALPLTLVREIIRLDPTQIQLVSGRPSLVLRGEVQPVIAMADLLHVEEESGKVGLVIHDGDDSLVLKVDSFVGQDEVMIKTLDKFRPKGVAGATQSGDGSLVLVLDLAELLTQQGLKVAA